MVTAVLIDDEDHCLDTLSMLLRDFCPDVDVVARCQSPLVALDTLSELAPDIVFLDIEMPHLNGFELLEKLGNVGFTIIFTTSYDQYAIKAIKFSALDYLLKPIDPKELIAAIHKAVVLKKPSTPEQVNMLLERVKKGPIGFRQIAVPTLEGFELIPAEQVVRCEADSNYTHLFLKTGRRITACRTLKEVEEQLEDFGSFIRVHHSHIVNLNEVSKYIKGEGGYLIMNDESTVSVSRSRREALLKYF